MPTNSNSGRSYYTPADPWQIASTNATIQTLLGGRQRSWMTGGAKITKPTVPTHTHTTIHTISQTNTQPSASNSIQPVPQVLPSPAPSDEPSPAVSNPLDSPHPRNLSLFDNPSMDHVAPSPGLPSTEARFVYDGSPYAGAPSAPPTMNQPQTISAGNIAATIPNQTSQNVPQNVSQIGLHSQTQPTNTTVSSAIVTNFAQGSHMPPAMSTAPREQVRGPPVAAQEEPWAPPAVNANPQAQDTASPMDQPRSLQPGEVVRLSYSGFVATIDAWKDQCRGNYAFSADLESPRLQLVREACSTEDSIFVALHQLFCIWSYNREEAAAYLGMSTELASNAFSHLEQVLKKNENMSETQWTWFRQFPGPIQQLVQHTDYPAVIQQVALFLQRFTANYVSLMTVAFTRRYPCLVEELLTYLCCFSPSFQKIIFTASRRALGVVDGVYGSSIEQAFAQDQQNHRDPQTGLFRQPPVYRTADVDASIKQRNASLIQYYQQVVAQQGAAQIASHSPQSPAMSTPQQPWGSAQQAMSRSQVFPSSNMAVTRSHLGPVANTSIPSRQSPVLAQNGFTTQVQMPSALASSASPPQNNFTAQPDSPSTLAAAGLHPVPVFQVHRRQQQAGRVPSQHRQSHQSVRTAQLTHRQQMPSSFVGNYHTPLVQQPQPQQPQAQPWATGSAVAQAIQQPRQLPTVNPLPSTFIPPMVPVGSQLPTDSNIPMGALNPQIPPQRLGGGVRNGSQSAQSRPKQLPPDEMFFPVKGYTIPRTEWPFDPSEQKAIYMSLHQADLRSPKRAMRVDEGSKGSKVERHYQYPQAFPVGPVSVPFGDRVRKFNFRVTEAQFSSITTGMREMGDYFPTMLYFNGALRWRVRCCKLPKPDQIPLSEEWSALETFWPMNIYMSLNGKPLSIRRHSHNGKDLPTELTSSIIIGDNLLEVCIPTNRRENQAHYFLSVEELVTVSHSSIMQRVMQEQVIPESATLAVINRRLAGSSGGEDGDIVFQASDLSVDLADPFTATLFKIPARGSACKHLECFDLETWLNTRPTKTPRKCNHGAGCGCSRGEEPSLPDKWKCPICSLDARPCSLRVDTFMMNVRRKLEQDRKLQAKRMHVAADGTWKVTVEEDSDDDSDDDDDEPSAKRRRTSQPALQPMKKSQPPVEVIILDDD